MKIGHFFRQAMRCSGLLALLFLCTVFFKLSAQAPNKVWDSNAGSGLYDDFAYKIIPMSGGGFVIAGAKQISTSGNHQAQITRVAADGSLMWSIGLGNNNTYLEEFHDVIVTSDGNLLAVGYINISPATDFYVAKLNASTGATIFTKQFQANDNDYIMSLLPTDDGNYIIAGYSDSEVNGDKAAANQGTGDSVQDYWLMKISGTDGSKMSWGTGTDKTYGGSAADILTKMIRTRDGGYLLIGHSTSGISGNKSEANKGSNDYWVVKINANGAIVWDKTFGTNGDDQAYGAAAVTGGYVIGGYTPTTTINGDKTATSKGLRDFWLIKIDENGTKIWDKTIGTTAQDFLNDIAPTSDGGFIIAGYTTGGVSGNKTMASRGAEDFWLVKVDADGTIQWDKGLGGTASDQATAILQDDNGDYLVIGKSYSNINGDKTSTRVGQIDNWLVKLGALSFTATATAITCNDIIPNSDGALRILTNQGITKFGYSIGSVYTGPAYASATAAGSAPYNLIATLPNPTVSQPYTIRGFIDATTYLDKVVSLPPVACATSNIRVAISPVKTFGSRDEILSHTVTVSNTGPRTANNVIVEVLLPDSVSYVSSTAQQGNYIAADKLWKVGTVAVGSPLTLTVRYKIN